MNWKDIGFRALKTALQSFLAVLVAAGTHIVSVSTLKAAGVATLAALVSFVQNVIVNDWKLDGDEPDSASH